MKLLKKQAVVKEKARQPIMLQYLCFNAVYFVYINPVMEKGAKQVRICVSNTDAPLKGL